MDKKIKNWIDSALYDLETAKHMFKTGRYIYTVFTSHLALEKIIKAKIEEITDKTPIKTHDLSLLLEQSGLRITEEQESFILKISNISVVTRYPEDFDKISSSYTKKKTREILDKTKEVFKWIMQSLKL